MKIDHHHRITSLAVAYLWSVSTASFAFNLLLVGHAFFIGEGFEAATQNDLLTKASHLFIMLSMSFVAGWIFAFITAFIPFTIGMEAARLLNATHWSYYVVGASIAAIAICPLFNAIPNIGFNVQGTEPTSIDKFWSVSPYFLVCGALSGFICWFSLQRKST